MGLDSVELLFEIETWFGIEIPPLEAERIVTVQDMVETVARHRQVSGTDAPLREDVLHRLSQECMALGLTQAPLRAGDLVFAVLNPKDTGVWTQVSTAMGMELPIPFRRSGSVLPAWLLSGVWTPRYDWRQITAGHFVTAICAHNFENLLDRRNITNPFEVGVVVMALTAAKTGVDLYEVLPEKSFSRDLGLD